MSLITVDELRARAPGSTLSDTDLQLIIDANEILLRDRLGSTTGEERTIRLRGYPSTVLLLPEAIDPEETVEIVEHWIFADPANDITLAEDDWRLAPDGTAIERLVEGTNQRDTFAEEVEITFTPVVKTALWKNILIQLAKLDLNFSPGLRRQRLGDYEEEQASTAEGDIHDQKEAILAQLAVPLPVFF